LCAVAEGLPQGTTCDLLTYVKLRERFGHTRTARCPSHGCSTSGAAGVVSHVSWRATWSPALLCRCDPVEPILDVCRANGVPTRLARTDFLPERLPFDQEFDLVFAFSVFTHISAAAHEWCLQALHESLAPAGSWC
jgi:hypothetical protein